MSDVGKSPWFVYLIRCNGGFLYTGITTDIKRRFAQHQCGKGAKYLRGKAPLHLVHQQLVGTHSEALKEEIRIKKLPKAKKEILCSNELLKINVS
ncbi:MAG: GIY-YIG nuclease family protein [Mariprofundaceae bacterium]